MRRAERARLESAMILLPVVFVLALARPPVSPTVTCESGRLVAARTLERSEGPGGGPSPAAPDERPPSSGRGALHFLTFRCGDRTWEASIPEGTPGLRREDLRPRDGVTFRVEGGKLYLKRSDGTDLVLHVSNRRLEPDARHAAPAPK
jgi:hypothetical protein